MRVEISDVRAGGELATLLHLERPRGAGVVVYAGVALFAAGIAYLAIATTERVSRGSGVMRPSGEAIEVDTPLGGRVAEVLVEEGQKVVAGEVLVRLVDPDVELGVQVKRQSLRLAGERARAIIEHEEAQLRADLSVAKAECGALERELESLRDLLRAGAISRNEVDNKVDEIAACKGRASPIAVRERQIEAARRRVAELVDGGVPAVATESYDPQVASALAEIEVLAAELRGAEAKRDDLSVAAPRGGVITKLTVHHAGEVVAPGSLVAELAPVGSEIVFEAFVGNGEVGDVRTGQEALIHLDAYPRHEFGSVRARVSRVFPDAELRGGVYGFRVILALDSRATGPRIPVRLGLSGAAEIVTGHRSLGSFLLKGSRDLVTD